MKICTASEPKASRLASLLAEKGRDPRDSTLAEVVEDAQIVGSLELSGIACSWEDVRGSRRAAGAAPAAEALRRARAAVPAGAPLTRDVLRTWHAALDGTVGFRGVERARADAPPPAPPELIEGRLETLEQWLGSAGVRELQPGQLAALAYARIVEILPFADGNGRVARLAASHVMVGAGMPPPILVGADGPYLVACLRAAFRLDTAALVALFDEASGRALEVMIQALERGEA